MRRRGRYGGPPRPCAHVLRLAMQALLILHACTLAPADAAGAQTMRGRVVGEDGGALAGASIRAISEAGDTSLAILTDAGGAFALRLAEAGPHNVRVERAGFRGFVTEAIEVAAGEEVALELRLAPAEVVEVPVTILGRRRIEPEDYRQRAGFMRLLDMGSFVGEGDIEALRATATSELLAAIGGVSVAPSPDGPIVQLATDGPTCEPALFVDGLSFTTTALDRVLTPAILQAVEIYRGEVEAPTEFTDPRGCGVILLWTRRSDERPLPWRRAVVYVGMIAIGIALFAR